MRDSDLARAVERRDDARVDVFDDEPSLPDRLFDAGTRIRVELAKNPTLTFAFVGRDTLEAIAAWLEADAGVARDMGIERADDVRGYVEAVAVADAILWDEP